MLCVLFFFNDTATTEIYTLSLHDALPISLNFPVPPVSVTTFVNFDVREPSAAVTVCMRTSWRLKILSPFSMRLTRSEEHTSELQSLAYLVCRLLLEKKKRSVPRSHLEHAN